MSTLCITTNKQTGLKRYYIDGVRVDQNKFANTIFWKTQDCLTTRETPKLIKHFSCVR